MRRRRRSGLAREDADEKSRLYQGGIFRSHRSYSGVLSVLLSHRHSLGGCIGNRKGFVRCWWNSRRFCGQFRSEEQDAGVSGDHQGPHSELLKVSSGQLPGLRHLRQDGQSVISRVSTSRNPVRTWRGGRHRGHPSSDPGNRSPHCCETAPRGRRNLRLRRSFQACVPMSGRSSRSGSRSDGYPDENTAFSIP